MQRDTRLCESISVITALSSWWTVGWAVGAVVVLLVAVLLLAITGLARKIDGVAQDLVTDLDSIARKTEPLQNVAATNNAVQTITRCLRKARGAAPVLDKYRTSPGWRE
jgi:hypothetical protein